MSQKKTSSRLVCRPVLKAVAHYVKQMTSVGLGSKAIMDVVYIYEQLHANASDDWRNTERAWDVVLRKEVFCPWPESWVSLMLSATVVLTKSQENIDIIFHQIIDGMQRGHYTCPTPSDLALVLAQVYYIQQGPALQEDSFRAFLRNFRPAGCVRRCSPRCLTHE